MVYHLEETQKFDPELFQLIKKEEVRQKNTLELIASESIQSPALLEINGCAFNNKTAVGHLDDMHMAGSQFANELMKLAAKRACELYGADHANVQVYSGSTANYSVYAACLNPGDTVLSMDPHQGGHATHGSKTNVVAKFLKFEHYGVDKTTQLIDYDALEKQALDVKPKLIICGGSNYSQYIDYKRMAEIAKKAGAYLHADMAHFTGLVAAGLYPNPVPYADFVTGSTTKTICGPRYGFILCKKEHAEKLDNAAYPGIVASLHLQTMAAMATAFEFAKTDMFKHLMRDVVNNTNYLSDELQRLGYKVLSNGTKCHLLVMDVRDKGINAKELTKILETVGISVNPVDIPYDTSPVRNGVRMGCTVLSQRGMGKPEMIKIASLIDTVCKSPYNDAVLSKCREEVKNITDRFPLYGRYDSWSNELSGGKK